MASLFNEGLSNPQQAAGGGLLHDTIAVSGVHPHAHKCGTSKAVCTPSCKIADSLRLWALSVLSTHQNCGTSQALCTPMMKIADSLRLCAPPSQKLGDVSGSCLLYTSDAADE